MSLCLLSRRVRDCEMQRGLSHTRREVRSADCECACEETERKQSACCRSRSVQKGVRYKLFSRLIIPKNIVFLQVLITTDDVSICGSNEAVVEVRYQINLLYRCKNDCGKKDCKRECDYLCAMHFDNNNRKKYEDEFNELIGRFNGVGSPPGSPVKGWSIDKWCFQIKAWLVRVVGKSFSFSNRHNKYSNPDGIKLPGFSRFKSNSCFFRLEFQDCAKSRYSLEQRCLEVIDSNNLTIFFWST